MNVDLADQLSPQEARVVGALIEKAGTTPDNYPLSTNALVAACNQSTNREPVVDYSEREVDAIVLELRARHLARTLSGAGHRVSKHRHVVDETLGLDGPTAAVLAVLLLRGPQTLNEITTRTERYSDGPGGDTEEVEAAIDRLVNRDEPLAARLDRQPGEREPRIVEIWTGEQQAPVMARPVEAPPSTPSSPASDLETRVSALEEALAHQTARLDALLDDLDA